MRKVGYALLYTGLALMVIGMPTCIGSCFAGLGAPETDAPIGTSEAGMAVAGITLGAFMFAIGAVSAPVGAVVLGRSSYY